MTVKRSKRLDFTSGFFSYALDYGLKHKQLDPETDPNLLKQRDPLLISRKSRAITVLSDNCNAYNPEPDFKHVRTLWDKKQKKNQAGSYVLSLDNLAWSELNTYLTQKLGHTPSEIDKYDELASMGLHLGRMIAGKGNQTLGSENYQIAVQTHFRQNNMHAHIEINTINLNTGIKDMNYSNDELTLIYGYADKLYHDRNMTTGAGLEVLRDNQGHRITQRKGGYDVHHQGSIVQAMIKKGRYSYIDDLNLQFELVLASKNVNSKKDAVRELEKRGISVDQWSDRYKYIKLHWNALKIDIKAHGKFTQHKGDPSRSIRLKTYTRQEADLELKQKPDSRSKTLTNLAQRKRVYDQYGRTFDFSQAISKTSTELSNLKTGLSQSQKGLSELLGASPETIASIERLRSLAKKSSDGRNGRQSLHTSKVSKTDLETGVPSAKPEITKPTTRLQPTNGNLTKFSKSTLNNTRTARIGRPAQLTSSQVKAKLAPQPKKLDVEAMVENQRQALLVNKKLHLTATQRENVLTAYKNALLANPNDTTIAQKSLEHEISKSQALNSMLNKRGLSRR